MMTVSSVTTPLNLIEAPVITGDVAALTAAHREATIAKHLPLIRYVARSMARHASASPIVDYDDLIGYGTEGLIEAVDTFNPAYNVKFSTWAVMHIRTTIQDALRALDPLPRSLRSKSKEIERTSHDLANRNGYWPQDAQVAAELNIPLQRLRVTMQEISKTCVSLDKIDDGKDDDAGHSWLSSLADEDPESDPEAVLDHAATQELVVQAIAQLPERERSIVQAYYRQSRSMREIADDLGVSESRVSQLHARALKLLRGYISDMLEDAPPLRTAA